MVYLVGLTTIRNSTVLFAQSKQVKVLLLHSVDTVYHTIDS